MYFEFKINLHIYAGHNLAEIFRWPTPMKFSQSHGSCFLLVKSLKRDFNRRRYGLHSNLNPKHLQVHKTRLNQSEIIDRFTIDFCLFISYPKITPAGEVETKGSSDIEFLYTVEKLLSILKVNSSRLICFHAVESWYNKPEEISKQIIIIFYRYSSSKHLFLS